MRSRPARRLRITPWQLDVLVTAVLVVAGIVLLFIYTDPSGVDYRDGDARGVLIVVAVTAPLLFRRRWPLGVGLVTAAALLPFMFWDYAMPTAAVVIVMAVYTAGNHASLARSIVVTASHLAASVAYTAAFSARHPEQSQYDGASLIINFMLLASAWGVGRYVRSRRLYTAELEDRARRLERAGEAEVRAAIAEERSRIARELHDVVAHHVSVMTVQAAGARRSLARDPERSNEALLSVEATGRAALSEMRRVVGVLRGSRDEGRGDGAADLAPQPGLGDLDTLVEQMRAAGLPVRVTVEGEPDSVPIGVDLTAYRVVQEALTNTIKHAGPSRAWVFVRYRPNGLEVDVSDDGHGVARTLEQHPRGHGLLGMRERVALYGGSLAVGPRPGGGYAVRARIPYENSAV